MATVVLLPGIDGTGDMFAEFAHALGNEHKPIIVSYPTDRAIGYDELQTFVQAYLPVDEPFVLLGECFSGPIAVAIAASRPRGLIGLVLCCTYVSNPLPIFRPFKSLIGVLPISSKLVGLINPLVLNDRSSSKLRQAIRQALNRVPASILRTRLRAIIDVDVTDKLKMIQVPTLYLQAAQDRIIPASALTRIKEQSPGMMVEQLQGPHLLLQTIPGEAATVVKNFIETAVAVGAAAKKEGEHAVLL